ncbi:MAG: SufE family protein [Pseudomonadota bacterium]
MAPAAFEEIVEDFEFLESWEDRYRHVIDLGKKKPALAPSQRNATTKVDGCASQVWLVPQVDGTGPSAQLRFEGESDALIVSGLIAVLQALYNDQTAEEILNTDASAQMARLGLDQHLSAQRSNGLRAMIARVRALASAAQES